MLSGLWRLPRMPEGPLPLQRFGFLQQAPHLLGVFLPLFMLYLFTAPRTLVLEDDGLFVLSGYFLGIEHPPGFPLYVLFAKLATLVPVASVAWRVHALSGLFGALACVALWLCARVLIPGRIPAYLAAFAYGVSLTFWSQALIAEVYTLNSLFFFLLLYLCLREATDGAPHGLGARPYAIALILGLGLSNHWPLLLLSAPALLLVTWSRRRAYLARSHWLVLTCMAGLLPYAWMVWRSRMLPEVSFSGPIDDWSEFLFVLARTGYKGVDAGMASDWSDKLGYIAFLGRALLVQMTPAGFLLAAAGFLGQRRGWRPGVSVALLAAFLGPSLVLVLLLNFDDQWLQRMAFRVYPLVAWGVLALWAALGLHLISERLPARARGPLTLSLAVLPILWSVAAHWQTNDRRLDRLGHEMAETILEALPPDAILFVTGDTATATVAYLNRVEAVRPDVTVMSEQGLVLEPRLFDPMVTSAQERDRLIDEFLGQSERPVLFLHGRGGRPLERSWLTFLLAGGDDSGRTRFHLTRPEREFIEKVARHGEYSDGWSERERHKLLAGFVEFVTAAELAGVDPSGLGDSGVLTELAMQVPEAKLKRAEMLARANTRAWRGEIEALLLGLLEQMDWRLEKSSRADYFVLLGHLALQDGRLDLARQALAQSAAIWPHPDNPALRTLQALDAEAASGEAAEP